MKILSLELENIRSHKNCKVDFADGVTLLEGDIGSGKSSLLYAIEFALFGLGDLNASFLLRNNANSGWVKLDFSVGEKKFVVFRSLERKKESVQQGAGWVEDVGVRSSYAPSEIKPAVLKILGFNEPPSPKAVSTIYRYAVFTPQEELKQILAESVEERLKTLRKAFGIEEYKQARENADLVRKAIVEQTRFVEGQVSQVEGLTSEKRTLEKQLESGLARENEAGKKMSGLSQEVDSLKALVKKLSEKKSVFESLSNEIPLLERRFAEKQRSLTQLRSSAKDYAEEKTVLEKDSASIFLPQQIPDVVTLEKNARQVRTEMDKTSAELGALEAKLGDYDSLRKTGECPTCGQTLSTDFAEKTRELSEHAVEKRAVLQKLKADEQQALDLVQEARDFALKKRRFDEIQSRLQRVLKQTAEAEVQLSTIEKELPALETELRGKTSVWEKEKPAIAELQKTEADLDVKDRAFRSALQEKAAAGAEVKTLGERIVSIELQLEEKEKQKHLLSSLKERSSWIEGFFSPALASIETHVMLGLSQDFDSLFRKWFSLLVESEDLSVAADEQFNPLVEINGYEQSYQTLSGGEKSALALAYRLALNSVVRATTESLRDNLLILDEPTDGFSKEQLARMRDVFLQLDCKQILLVSHERELEAFADKIYKIEKTSGESRIIS